MSGEKTDTVESKVDDRAPDGAEVDEPAQPKTQTAETETAETETAETETAEAEPAEPRAAEPEPVEVAPVPAEPVPAEPVAAAPVPVAEGGAGSRRPVAVLAMVSVALLAAAVVFGVLFGQERSQRQQAERDLAAQTALAKQRETDLEALRAQRTEIERKLATAEAQLLSPEAKAAITACVKSYVAMEKAVADAERTGYGSSSFQYAVPVGAAPGQLCTAAEPHLAKLA